MESSIRIKEKENEQIIMAHNRVTSVQNDDRIIHSFHNEVQSPSHNQYFQSSFDFNSNPAYINSLNADNSNLLNCNSDVSSPKL